MKAVYSWDKDKHLDTINLVDDDYQLEPNETFTKPDDGLYEPISWTGSTWVGVSKEEWEAAHPQHAVEPSAGEQALNALGLQVASLITENKQLKQSVNVLGLQVAQAIAKDNKENGGN